MVRIYERYSEIFKHIAWKGVGIQNSCLVTFKEDELAEREKFRLKFFKEVAENGFKKMHLDEQYTSEMMTEIRRTFYEMIKNAEQATPKRKGFMAEFYQGERGVLFGTRQDKIRQNRNFLTAEQIFLLQQGCAVPSEKREDGSGNGTKIMLDFADGLYINQTQRLIVVSKLVEKLK